MGKNKPKKLPLPEKTPRLLFHSAEIVVDDLGLKSPSFCLNPKPSTLEFAAVGEEQNMQWEKGEGAFNSQRFFFFFQMDHFTSGRP